jgi:RNA polymerase sigma-70 factor, ECF subfamily
VQETDPALIRAAAAGDLDAVEQIVRAHQQEVWRFLRRLLGDDGAAEDVAQETFLRMYRRLPTYAFEAKFSTWVFQIAHNAAIDELRARERRSRALRSVPPVAPAAGPAATTRAEIDAALASLPVALREALLVVEVLGLRYAEAAAVLGVAEGTMKSRVFAARRRLAAWGRAGESERPAASDGSTVTEPERASAMQRAWPERPVAEGDTSGKNQR